MENIEYAEPKNGCKYFDVSYYTNGTFVDMDYSPDKRYAEVMRLNCYRKGRYSKRSSYADSFITFGELVKSLTKVALLYDNNYLPNETKPYLGKGLFIDLFSGSWQSHYANDALRIGLVSSLDMSPSDAGLLFDGEREPVMKNVIQKIVWVYEYLNGPIDVTDILKEHPEIRRDRFMNVRITFLKAYKIGIVKLGSLNFSKKVTRMEFAKMFITAFGRHLTIQLPKEIVESKIYTTMNIQLRQLQDAQKKGFVTRTISDLQKLTSGDFLETYGVGLDPYIYSLKVTLLQPFDRPTSKDVMNIVLTHPIYLTLKEEIRKNPSQKAKLIEDTLRSLALLDKALFFGKTGITAEEFAEYIRKNVKTLFK